MTTIDFDRINHLAGLEDADGKSVLAESVKLDEKHDDKDDEDDEAEECFEVDESDLNEIAESIRLRKKIRSELEGLWASGQVFGRKGTSGNGIAPGAMIPGIGFKRMR